MIQFNYLFLKAKNTKLYEIEKPVFAIYQITECKDAPKPSIPHFDRQFRRNIFYLKSALYNFYDFCF